MELKIQLQLTLRNSLTLTLNERKTYLQVEKKWFVMRGT